MKKDNNNILLKFILNDECLLTCNGKLVKLQFNDSFFNRNFLDFRSMKIIIIDIVEKKRIQEIESWLMVLILSSYF